MISRNRFITPLPLPTATLSRAPLVVSEKVSRPDTAPRGGVQGVRARGCDNAVVSIVRAWVATRLRRTRA